MSNLLKHWYGPATHIWPCCASYLSICSMVSYRLYKVLYYCIGTFTTLSVTTDANVSGTVTATSYKGSGLSLTNLAGTTTGKAIALQLIT